MSPLEPGPLQVLLVDDDDVDRMAAQRVLQRTGELLVVTEASDAQSALEKLRTGSFDCVLLDFQLPGKDGLWLLKTIQAEGLRLPVVMLTGQGDEETAVELMKAGATDYLPKASLTAARLSQTLRHIITRRQMEGIRRKTVDFEQQLVGIVSHDLRNPISAILLAAQMLLRREDLDAQTVRTLKRIAGSGERASRLIRDLLDFTKATLGGGIAIQVGPADLHELLQHAVDEVQLAHTGRRIEVKLQGDGHGTWDADRLSQAFTNVLVNAVTYSPVDQPVLVLVTADDASVTVEVQNGGTPIPPESMPVLFQPFRRGTQAGGDGGSVGLGLFIVQQLVRAHGGTIKVSSTEEEGTRFKIRLPRLAASPPKDAPGPA